MIPRSFLQRFLFTGTLRFTTGSHVGSSWTAGSPSNNPVIRLPDGRPFIPGSSFKGAFRSTVEKLAVQVGLTSCLLMDPKICISIQGKQQQCFDQRRQAESWDDETLWAELEAALCHTCKLFGSPYTAARLNFADLLPPADDTPVAQMIQIRDGVAIDRDSEKAVDRLKYDYEVVAPDQTFEVRIILEDPGEFALALTCLGLSEFVNGFGYVGGKRSRGLGNCRLEDLAIYQLDLQVEDPATRAERLRQYIRGQTLKDKMTHVSDSQAFLLEQIDLLPAIQEGSDAEATG